MANIMNYLIMTSIFSITINAEIKCYNPVLNWFIAAEGFHRDITYDLEIVTNDIWSDCKLIIKQLIPSNFYVNKDQLEDLRRLGKVIALVNDFVDTETPEDLSEPIVVHLVSRMNETDANSLQSKEQLPIHLRYHSPLAGGGFRVASLPSPELFLNCGKVSANCLPNMTSLLPCSTDFGDLCIYHLLSYAVNKDSLEIDIPVGNSDQYDTVLLVTYFVTIAGSIYIYTVVLLSLPKK